MAAVFSSPVVTIDNAEGKNAGHLLSVASSSSRSGRQRTIQSVASAFDQAGLSRHEA
jgi:hypothetical protein